MSSGFISKKTRLKLVIVLLSLFLLTLSAEILCRTLGLAPQVKRLDMSSVNMPEFEGTYRLSYHPDIYYEPRPGSGAFNSYGIRGPEPSKNGDLRRVAFLGDSVGFGINLPYEHTLPSILTRKMPGYEFLNFSVPGYDFRQYVATLKHRILPLKPDIVLFLICMNDFGGSTIEFDHMRNKIKEKIQEDPDFLKKYTAASSAASSVFANAFMVSSLVRFLYFKYSKKNVKDVNSLNANDSIQGDRLVSLLEEIKKYSSEHNFKYHILFLPQGGNRFNNFNGFRGQIEVVRDNKSPYLDLHSEVMTMFADPAQRDRVSEIFLDHDTVHFNGPGHEFMADLLMSHSELW